MQWHKHVGNALLSALAISQLGIAGCTTMPSGPQSPLCLQAHNAQVGTLAAADLTEQPKANKEQVICSADATAFGFIAQLPNTNALDPDVRFPGTNEGSWKLGFGSLDQNIAGQYDVPITEPGVYKMRVAIKSDQPTNFALLCGFNGLGENDGFGGIEQLVHVDKDWKQANCTFVVPEGKQVSALQLGFRATPSDTPRNDVTLWVGPMQIVKTDLSPSAVYEGDGGGDPGYPDEKPDAPPPAKKPYLGI